jgi:hypothetical protein
MRKVLLPVLIVFVVLFSACSKSSEDYEMAALTDYSPLIVGKYVTYQLDSLRYINFGTKDTTFTYQVKHYVDAQITDALGRPAYRIIRYIRKTSADAWMPDNTFMTVPVDNTIEFIENNLRYIKLKRPIRNDYSWKGNTYIDTYSLNSDLKYMDDWDYTYDSVNVSSKVGAFTLDSTLRVNQQDETVGNPADPTGYSERNLSYEKYAKNIGLVYRKFLHSEYQPSSTGVGPGKYSDGSYGVTLTMIDHN